MKYLILFTMSLLSLLFGCNTKKTPEKVEEYPRFPATDHPEAKVIPVALDSNYWLKSYYITPDKQNVYVLGYRKIVKPMKEGEEPNPGEPRLADYRLYSLDNKGQIIHRLDLPRDEAYAGGSFVLLDNQLMLGISGEMLVLDQEKFTIQEKIPIYDSQSFPSKQDVELMTPDEQRDAYQEKFDAILAKPASCRWLEWSPGGGYLIFVQGPPGKRSAWDPISWEDEALADLKSRFEPMVVARNPNANNYEKGENFRCVDGPVQIRELDYLSAGTQLDWPNYKNRTVVQYEMIVGAKTLHFSTTDKSRHNLRMSFADNLMLSTSDGSGWLAYEGILYRVE